MTEIISLAALAAAFAAALVALRAAREQAGRLADVEQRLERTEARLAAPEVTLAFEYDPDHQHASLRVTNTGPRAELRVPVTVHGALTEALPGPVFARWAHTETIDTLLEPAQSAVVRLGQLELSFPFAQWHLFLTDAAGEPVPVSAARTSLIGGVPTGNSTILILESAVLDGAGRGKRFAVILRPFSAEWVAPQAFGRPRRSSQRS